MKLIERFPGCYVEEEPRVNVCISEKTVRALTEGQGEAYTRLIREMAERVNRKNGVEYITGTGFGKRKVVAYSDGGRVVVIRPGIPGVWCWSWPFRGYSPIGLYVAYCRVTLGYVSLLKCIWEGARMWWGYMPFRREWGALKATSGRRTWWRSLMACWKRR